MSNRQDNNPSLDYFELRRRHEAYKNRERQADREKGAEERPQKPPVAPEAVAVPEAGTQNEAE